MKQHYIVTEDADLIDGAEKLKGVKVGDQIAKIGDTISFDGKRLLVERR